MNLASWLNRLNPWHTLFGKIFLWFWLTTLVMIAVTSFTVKNITQPYQIQPASEEAMVVLTKQGRRVLQLFARFGGDTFYQLQRINERERIQIYLVDEEYRVIGKPRPPKQTFPMLSSMIEEQEPVFGIWQGETWLGPAEIQINDSHFSIFLRGVHNAEANTFVHRLKNSSLVVPLALILSGLLCGFLAWSFSRPLRHFRRASQQLAGGQLSTRLGTDLTQRLDEFGDLGRDFDHMADRLENLVSAQQRLLSNVSHELRSPITRIQVALGIAHQKANIEVQQTLNRIERETGKLEEMIAQVLKLSRLENQLQNVPMGPVDLAQLLKQLVEDADFEAQAVNKRVSLNSGHSGLVEGEAPLLHSAIENVIRNGIRYTPENALVEVASRNIDWPGVNGHSGKQSAIEIVVRDHGPGASQNALEHLFEPFYRAVENTADGGAGLGLSIADQIVKRHRGKVFASNHPEGGLQVSFQFPVIQESKVLEAEEEQEHL